MVIDAMVNQANSAWPPIPTRTWEVDHVTCHVSEECDVTERRVSERDNIGD